MNRLFIILILFFLLNNCSLNENSKIWKDQDNDFSKKENIKKIFSNEKSNTNEFNKGLIIDLSSLTASNKIFSNKNNFGLQKYIGNLKKIDKYNFSKLEDINQINFKPIFLSDGLVFFDKKGSIIRYGRNNKFMWKQNYYSKGEKKLKPKLNFLLKDDVILVTDSIAKYYSINLETGELNWLKSNAYPFNSDIKFYKNKIFVVDYKNTL